MGKLEGDFLEHSG